MRLLALFAVGLFAGVVMADDKKDEKKPKDEEAILGKWKVEKYDTGGLKDASAEVRSKAELRFSESGRMMWAYPKVEYKAEYKLDPDAKPKTLDMSTERGTVGAIYELDGDTLRIAFTINGQAERPEELKADGKKVGLMTLKRVKDEKKSKDAEAIVGTWQVEKIDNGTGGSLLVDDPKVRMTFAQDGKMVVAGPSEEDKGEYTLDPDAKPKAIDMSNERGKTRAAYSLDGDTLTLAVCVGGRTERPEELKADGKGVRLMILKRVKEKKEEKKEK